MSNTANKLIGLVKSVSLDSLAKSNQTRIIENAVIASLVNPYSKEYRVTINGTQVTAYGIYEQTYKTGDVVRVIESSSDSLSDRYILGTSIVSAPTGESIQWDRYDLMGAPIVLNTTQTEYPDFTTYVNKAKEPYCRISADVTITKGYATGDFQSSVKILFEEAGKSLVYSTNSMEGTFAITSHQTSALIPLNNGEKTIKEVSIIDDNNYARWSNITIEVYDKVQATEATTLKIIAPSGDTVKDTETSKELKLESKLRKDFVRIDESDVTFIWFRENPLIMGPEDGAKYDERAGAGWEKITPPPKTE